jgi:hypothetical protein
MKLDLMRWADGMVEIAKENLRADGRLIPVALLNKI